MGKRYFAQLLTQTLAFHHFEPLQNDVLIWYLLDEMSALEKDYSDALAPGHLQYTESQAGEASSTSPLTMWEYQLWTEQQEARFTERLSAMETHLTTHIQSQISHILCHPLDPTASRSAGPCPSACHPAIPTCLAGGPLPPRQSFPAPSPGIQPQPTPTMLVPSVPSLPAVPSPVVTVGRATTYLTKVS
jgi:hypothetical protein